MLPHVPDIHKAKDLFDAGELQQAEDLARECHAANRKDPEALQILGLIAVRRGLYDDASGWYEKCIALRRDRPILHCALAQVRVGQGRFKEAISRYDQALKLQPDFAPAVAGKASALERRGRFERAGTLLAPFVESGRETPEMALTFATLQVRGGALEEAVSLARRHVNRDDASPPTRRELWFVIGGALDKLERYDDAFDAFTQANALAAEPYDPAGRGREIDRLIAAFSPPALSALPRATGDAAHAELPVFVVGMPRSGSTLVEQVIDAHPQAFGAGELDEFNALVRTLPETLGTSQPYPECLSAMTAEQAGALSKSLLDRLARMGRRAVRVVDKNLRNIEHVGLISLLLPKARIIHCRRNPLDVCLSCYFQALSATMHPYASNLAHLGDLHRHYDRLAEHWRAVLNVRILEVSYEAFVADQEPMTRQLIEFCGLPWDDRCLRFYETKRDVATLSYDQVRQPVYRSSLKRYEHYQKHLGPLREALAE